MEEANEHIKERNSRHKRVAIIPSLPISIVNVPLIINLVSMQNHVFNCFKLDHYP